jgi:anti-anti-sigma factor
MFDTDRQGIWTVIRPVGEIDLAVADEFRATILEALAEGATDHLAIDFSEVTFLDSTGLNVIATALKETRSRGGRMVIVGPSERVRLVLEITGMTKIINIRDALVGDDQFAVESTRDEGGMPAASWPRRRQG